MRAEASSHHELNQIYPSTELLSNYTKAKTFTFRKVSFKSSNFRVSVYKVVILPWMKRKPSFHHNCSQTILLWKLSLSKKWIFNHTTLGCPFIRGYPPIDEMKTILRKLLSNYTTVKIYTYWKVSLKPYNFKVPINKGVILPWMKWKPFSHENCFRTIYHSINFIDLKSEL